MFKTKCSKIQCSVFGVLMAVTLAGVDGPQAHAQRSRSPRRITKSFTEPVLQSVAASPEVGIVVEANVQEGDQVQVGDVLAKINQRVLNESLAIAKARASSEARLNAATSGLKLLTSQLKAINSLVAGGHTNQFEVDQKQAEYQTAYAEYQTAQDEQKLNQLEVKRIQAQIEDRTIRSPINGLVTEIHKQLGENISNNNPEYATIVQVEELKVRFYLEEETLRKLTRGSRVRLAMGEQRRSITATIVYVSPIIDADSGLGRLDARIDNHDMSMRSGTICHWGGLAPSSESDTKQAKAKTENFSDLATPSLGKLPVRSNPRR